MKALSLIKQGNLSVLWTVIAGMLVVAFAGYGTWGVDPAAAREVVQTVAVTSSPGNIDVDEHRTDPVPHRYLHGRLGDANFQIVLPDDWNGKFLQGTRGFSVDEHGTGPFKDAGLSQGYAYALSDEGWHRRTVADKPEDSYYESRRRILQLTQYAKQVMSRHYGMAPTRTYVVGLSNGGHHTKWMVEDYPNHYDGGLSGFGYNSALEEFRGMVVFMRNFDIIRPRIGDIAAARAANPNWDPNTTPLNRALSDEQLQALNDIYDIPAQVGGMTYDIGRPRGTESTWTGVYRTLLSYMEDSIEEFDRFYDPNGDREVSVDEILQWDPYESKPGVQHELRKPDLTGDLQRPIIVAQGTWDTLVPPGEAEAYERLVERELGTAQARDVLATYYIPQMGHGGSLFNAFVPEALVALDQWADYIESAGTQGQPAPDALAGYPRAGTTP